MEKKMSMQQRKQINKKDLDDNKKTNDTTHQMETHDVSWSECTT